jgi:hypothetical protein
MNRELKELMSKKLDNYPTVYAKIALGEMSYEDFYRWASDFSTQQYFNGKAAVIGEHKKDIPERVRRLYTDDKDFL